MALLHSNLFSLPPTSKAPPNPRISLIGKIAGTFTFKLLGAVLNFGILVPGLSPGIAAVSLDNILVHFVSGLAQYRYNVRAAGLGLAVILPACGLLVPPSGLWGAALATSLSQLARPTWCGLSACAPPGPFPLSCPGTRFCFG